MLSRLPGVKPVEVKSKNELERVSGLILPGGESTTIGKLMRDFQLDRAIGERIEKGLPVWGTCAGMILLAKEIVEEPNTYLGAMDIRVRRNAYGSQLDSFTSSLRIDPVSNLPIPLVFIRAPWVERVYGSAEVLAALDGKIIAVRQGQMLATSFHPELTGDTAFHRFFAEMVFRTQGC
ncbi:glutamine amidotransferase subunit PdxT [Candidatus Formimonas warabiya]|uniref:Glutamine amidotransferase subunit PdxT n=2 Tax=Formimonas warabiya TaxID=1761012 RepID=A0A3G1L2E4_FORW1|nr:glutamine amidotransferase subunit PdxT [Candidatus Formimonas warabiya]